MVGGTMGSQQSKQLFNRRRKWNRDLCALRNDRNIVSKDARRDHADSFFSFRHYDDVGSTRSTRVLSWTDAEVEGILYSGIGGRRGELKLQSADCSTQLVLLYDHKPCF